LLNDKCSSYVRYLSGTGSEYEAIIKTGWELIHKVNIKNKITTAEEKNRRRYLVNSVADPDHFGKLVLDPDPHQSEKEEALVGHFGASEVQIWRKASGRIRIRIKLEGRIRTSASK
jgi:hypothetical protein